MFRHFLGVGDEMMIFFYWRQSCDKTTVDTSTTQHFAILVVEELQPILSVTGKQLVDAAVLLANGVEGRAL